MSKKEERQEQMTVAQLLTFMREWKRIHNEYSYYGIATKEGWDEMQEKIIPIERQLEDVGLSIGIDDNEVTYLREW